MKHTVTQDEQLARACDHLGYEVAPEFLAITAGVAVYVVEVGLYLIAQAGERLWWTNDLPLVVPDLLTEQAAAIRAERHSKCKGRGRCYAWCTGKRSRVVVQESDPLEEVDA